MHYSASLSVDNTGNLLVVAEATGNLNNIIKAVISITDPLRPSQPAYVKEDIPVLKEGNSGLVQSCLHGFSVHPDFDAQAGEKLTIETTYKDASDETLAQGSESIVGQMGVLQSTKALLESHDYSSADITTELGIQFKVVGDNTLHGIFLETGTLDLSNLGDGDAICGEINAAFDNSGVISCFTFCRRECRHDLPSAGKWEFDIDLPDYITLFKITTKKGQLPTISPTDPALLVTEPFVKKEPNLCSGSVVNDQVANLLGGALKVDYKFSGEDDDFKLLGDSLSLDVIGDYPAIKAELEGEFIGTVWTISKVGTDVTIAVTGVPEYFSEMVMKSVGSGNEIAIPLSC